MLESRPTIVERFRRQCLEFSIEAGRRRDRESLGRRKVILTTWEKKLMKHLLELERFRIQNVGYAQGIEAQTRTRIEHINALIKKLEVL